MQTSRLLAAAFICVLLIQGCSASGGGTWGTGLPKQQGAVMEGRGSELGEGAGAAADSAEAAPSLLVDIGGTVESESGEPVRGLELIIATEADSRHVMTDSKGRFSTLLKRGRNGTVVFSLGELRETARVISRFPDRSAVKMRLILTNDRILKEKK